MGVYLTIAELSPAWVSERELVQLSQDERGNDEVDEDVVNAAILAAERTVNSYVGRRYDLAALLSDPPPILGDLTAPLARWRLLQRRRDAITEDDRHEYRETMRTLRDVASGLVSLGEQPEPAPDPERRIRTGGRERRFTRPDFGDW